MKKIIFAYRIRKIFVHFKYYILGLYHRLDEHHAYLTAGGVAFSLFTCAVPFVTILFIALGKIFEKPNLTSKVFAFIDKLVPYTNQAKGIKDFLSERIEQISTIPDVAGIVGILILFLASTALFSSLRTILNRVFNVDNEESVLHGKLWDFVLVISVLVITVVLMFLIPVLETILELAKDKLVFTWFEVSFIDRVIVNIASFCTLTIVFSLIYKLVPYREISWKKVFIGAIWASLLWLLAKEVFGVYINHAATLKHIYGIYTFVVVSAFWIYYSALVLIIGAEIGQLYSERVRN